MLEFVTTRVVEYKRADRRVSSTGTEQRKDGSRGKIADTCRLPFANARVEFETIEKQSRESCWDRHRWEILGTQGCRCRLAGALFDGVETFVEDTRVKFDLSESVDLSEEVEASVWPGDSICRGTAACPDES